MRFLGTILIALVFLSAGPAGLEAQEEKVLEVDHFAEGVGENGLPKGWSLEKNPGPQSKISIGTEKDFYFVHLLSVKDAFGIKKEIKFDIEKYPNLNWKWRATKLPPKGDIRKRETDDQAGQLFVLFPKFPTTINTRSLGYIWDTHTPAGTEGTSPAYGKAKYVVLQSGPAKLNQWVSETRNVYEDYKKLFDEEPPPVGAVLIYINTQHTKGSAEINYADIYFSAAPPKKSGP